MRLRYEISNWHQATQCKSNNSTKIHIKVEDISSPLLSGVLIKAEHEQLGVLFAAITQGVGTLISSQDEEGHSIFFMETSQIITQLAKLGFDITYHDDVTLPAEQVTLLNHLVDLGMDTITKCRLGADPAVVVLAYSANDLNRPIVFNSTVPSPDHTTAYINVTATPQGKNMSWSWLNFTESIQDIIDAQEENNE